MRIGRNIVLDGHDFLLSSSALIVYMAV